MPHLRSLGLGRVVDLGRRQTPATRPIGAYGRMAEASAGQGLGDRPLGDDGHRPRPAVSDVSRTAFPPDVIAEFERRIGRGTLGNVVASGTEIIDRLGAEHVRTGKPIVYTSADSVFQIAAHEDVIPGRRAVSDVRDRLRARRAGAGRRPRDRQAVRRRPTGAFTRTANRHDYALDAAGRHAARSSDEAAASPSRRSARSTTCSPGGASPGRSSDGERRRRPGPRAGRHAIGRRRRL